MLISKRMYAVPSTLRWVSDSSLLGMTVCGKLADLDIADVGSKQGLVY